jgi:hypothetical protein
MKGQVFYTGEMHYADVVLPPIENEFWAKGEVEVMQDIVKSLKTVKTLERTVNNKKQLYNGKRWVNSYL